MLKILCAQRSLFQMNTIARHPKMALSAANQCIVSEAGRCCWPRPRGSRACVLCCRLADWWRSGRTVHDPGKILTDLAVVLTAAETAWLMSLCYALFGRWPSGLPGWSARWPPVIRPHCRRPAPHAPPPRTGLEGSR
jgi:hypothetical protein